MTASTLDTLSAMDELRDAGFDERQARAIIGTLRGADQGSDTPDEQATSECGRTERFTAVWIGGFIGFFVGVAVMAIYCSMLI